jgi:tetratricopeptide (TPR) repeat protein
MGRSGHDEAMPRPSRPLPASVTQRSDERQRLLAGARAALEQGDFAKARAMLAGPLRARTDDAAILSLAALAHRGLRDPVGALALFERALQLAPEAAPIRLAFAGTLIEANRAGEALAALDLLPDEVRAERAARMARADALGRLGDQQGEVAELRAIAREEPASVSVRLRLGHALRALGEADEAIAEYRAILVDEPICGAAWWSLANFKSARFDAADLDAMRAALADPALREIDRIRIGFALARAEEVAGRAGESFALYAAANELRHRRSKHDPDALERQVAAGEALFTREFFEARTECGAPSGAPIFIVGMQRSGSTLLEQMLASHSQVEGTAELPYINQLSREVQRDARVAGLSFEAHLATLDAAATRRLGETYLERAGLHRRSERPHFLDKMPNNWAHLGLIRLILPNARIIDVRRNPMACGFSNYRQLYASGLEHSYSLVEWGRFYRTYVRHMAHWDQVQPRLVTRVIYEALIEDAPSELRRLTDALGLEYEPAMLDFHRNRRTVRTISAQQVRQPLHAQAVDEWRTFEAWLGPLADALGSTLDSWNAPQEGTA